jgi:hypothetical protein
MLGIRSDRIRHRGQPRKTADMREGRKALRPYDGRLPLMNNVFKAVANAR